MQAAERSSPGNGLLGDNCRGKLLHPIPSSSPAPRAAREWNCPWEWLRRCGTGRTRALSSPLCSAACVRSPCGAWLASCPSHCGAMPPRDHRCRGWDEDGRAETHGVLVLVVVRPHT